ncbi:ABC transporter ATP-binding protein/permease [Bradyrhizobium diversitatis]|uniref:ABC transporter ATP-binding protein/permease n=1 Tax=Bradyrhizobium diversitatis TaxID=2755406 RepID=A0ABS0P695_9BRAD|nr:ABC transporter ATP-binding protein/permease [Bradyrhizobium diversitatis]MBH5388590.1 ABC transporter ATP-binding protein/permease [Bradyrhizobium diversitatis]
MNRIASLRTSLREVGRIAGPYFRSEERWSAIGLFVAIIGGQLALVGAAVAENYWRNAFYQALQDKDWDGFLTQFGVFSIIGVVFVLGTVYQRYLTQWLTIRWRRWLTARYVDEWLDGPVHYRAAVGGNAIDNPDQRIADDVRQFIDGVLSLTVGLIGAVARIVSFVAVLWTLSNIVPLHFFGESYVIPGYLVWAALIYSVLGTVMTHLIGRRLIAIDFERERREANFRFALVRIRENGEAVAMMRGEASEREDLLGRFAEISRNWYWLMRREQFVSLFAESYKYYSRYFPYFALSPLFFGGTMQLGAFMQAGSAFNSVHQGFSYFIGSYVRVAELAATVQRLSQFERTMAEAASSHEAVHPATEGGLVIENLEVSDRAGQNIGSLNRLTLRPGEAALLVGRSGAGKTSLLRSIAGLWPHVKGRVARPVERIMALPQRPYIPLGSLRRAVSYPASFEQFGNERLREVLGAVGLSHLDGDLDVVDAWERRLSEGEKQRLSLARVLLAEPDLILLDEATSALEGPAAGILHRELRQRLPGSVIISAGHDREFSEFYDKFVELEKRT